MVGHSQLVVEVGDVFARLGADDLLFDRDGFVDQFLSSSILLLLPQLDCYALHRSSFFVYGALVGLTALTKLSACSLSTILDDAGSFGFDGEGLRHLASNGHAAAVYTLPFPSVHHLEALVENGFRLFPFFASLMSLS